MPVTIREKNRGRVPNVTNTSETLEVKYIIRGATSTADARHQFNVQVPRTEPGESGTLTAQAITVDELNSAAGVYVGTVAYSLVDFSTGQTLFTFDTSGGTTNMKFGKGTVNSYSADEEESPPDYGGAINVTATDVQGVDITIPTFGFSATEFLHGTNVTGAYVTTLVGLTGTMNDATWSPTIDGIAFEFDRREVLFLGATGSRRGGGDFEVNKRFAVQPNATNLTVGGITGIAKAGWDYLWVQTQGGTFSDDTVAGQAARFVFVEQVYYESDFTPLGLG